MKFIIKKNEANLLANLKQWKKGMAPNRTNTNKNQPPKLANSDSYQVAENIHLLSRCERNYSADELAVNKVAVNQEQNE
jgi:hypothetical protein